MGPAKLLQGKECTEYEVVKYSYVFRSISILLPECLGPCESMPVCQGYYT